MAVQFSSRRLIFAGGVALAVVFAGAATAPASDIIAGPGCTVTQSNGSASVVCLPGVIPSPNAGPSAQDLTEQNMTRSRGGGLLGLGGTL
jgi:hypothetical protein